MATRPRSVMCVAKALYLRLLITAVLLAAFASFWRERAELLSNISLWLFLIALSATLTSERIGLLVSTALIGLSPSLQQQANALLDLQMHAWSFPGVDAAIGFIAGWTVRRGLSRADIVLQRFPSGALLLLQVWIAVSASLAVVRNLWQSASATSPRGAIYNMWLVRGISWLDDYYPLQGLFFYSVAIALVFCVWETMTRERDRMLTRLAVVLLIVIGVNAVFGAWQRWTGQGWTAGDWRVEVNALWPDLHSFGALMAIGFVVAGGLWVTRKSSLRQRVLLLLAMLLSAGGLFISGSRSTLVIVCASLVVLALWGGFRLSGWRRLAPLVVAVAALAGLHVLLASGYRGVSYQTLQSALISGESSALNAALSFRPQIWAAALRMYWASPAFGLGQGTFYRLSTIPDFSRSDALMERGGSGAHNYFLESFVELGPVGLLIGLFIFWPYARLAATNLRLLSAYALIGIALGNLYAHSLLVREMLMLAAIFGGSYLWEIEAHASDRFRPPGPKTTRAVALVSAALVCVALIDFASSFGRTPFTYGKLCFVERPLEADGWTHGVFRLQLPFEVRRMQLQVRVDPLVASHSGFDLDVAIVEGRSRDLLVEHLAFEPADGQPRSIALRVPTSLVDWRYLEIRPSRCYVPLNLGLAYDPRRLGVHVDEMRFYTAANAEVTATQP